MCGFVGIYSKSLLKRKVEPRLQRSCNLIAHRGPDDESFYFSDNVCLGFRRLKIIDMSDDGRQPFTIENGRHTITFNGEIYNYVELREELKALGHIFSTSSDTEVLIHGLAEWGTGCFRRLNGMFSIAWWDALKKRLVLARDRFGEKPLFYAYTSNGFVFGSEIKALFALSENEPTVNMNAVRTYLLTGMLDASVETFFGDVKSVSPAYYMEVGEKGVKEIPYWELEETVEPSVDVTEQFHDLFLDSLKLRSRSDVPIGTCLSGGLDSSAIVCGLSHLEKTAQINPTSRKSFSACYSAYDESLQIKDTTEKADVESYLMTPQPKSLDSLSSLIAFHDEPFCSFSVLAAYEVMRVAKRNGVIVVLNGQGADESLAGYGSYAVAALKDSIQAVGYWKSLELAKSFSLLTGKPAKHLMYRAIREINAKYTNRFSGATRRRLNRPFMTGLLSPLFLGSTHTLPTRKIPATKSHLKRSLVSGMFVSCLPNYVRQEDRNSMANSIESRLPFLDHRLVELAFSQDPLILMKGGQNKFLLRSGMGKHLPESVIKRKDKYGFPIPQAKWLFDHLKMEIIGLLEDCPNDLSQVFNVNSLANQFREDCESFPTEIPIQRKNEWFRIISVVLWWKHVNELKKLR